MCSNIQPADAQTSLTGFGVCEHSTQSSLSGFFEEQNKRSALRVYRFKTDQMADFLGTIRHHLLTGIN